MMSIMFEMWYENSRKTAIRYYTSLAINGFYFEEDAWWHLKKGGWSGVFEAFPDYQRHVNWSKIFSDDWLSFVQKNPEYIRKNQSQPLTSSDWCELLEECPQYAANCDWSTLDSDDRQKIISKHPQLKSFGVQGLSWKCLINKKGYARIPKGVVRIDERAFDGCTNLRRIDFPHSLVWIKREAFCGCTGLEKIAFPPNLMRIDEYAFIGCGLTQVLLPEGIESVKKETFDGRVVIFQNRKNEKVRIK